MKKCYATIHVWLHDMDHNIDLNYRRKIRPMIHVIKHDMDPNSNILKLSQKNSSNGILSGASLVTWCRKNIELVYFTENPQFIAMGGIQIYFWFYKKPVLFILFQESTSQPRW